MGYMVWFSSTMIPFHTIYYVAHTNLLSSTKKYNFCRIMFRNFVHSFGNLLFQRNLLYNFQKQAPLDIDWDKIVYFYLVLYYAFSFHATVTLLTVRFTLCCWTLFQLSSHRTLNLILRYF
jgi:hypothetical protein